MVYAGKVKNSKRTLGVSGRLMQRNLVMWDAETDSLWSQLTGEALHGKAKGEKLDMLPAVFVGFGTWKKLHPKTKVLDLELVRAKGWHFTTDDLAAGYSQGRGRKQHLGVGLRHGKDTLLIPMADLHAKKSLQVTVDGIALEVRWDETEKAVFVHERSQATDAKSTSRKAALPFPYLPTYLSAWKGYYPKGRVHSSEK